MSALINYLVSMVSSSSPTSGALLLCEGHWYYTHTMKGKKEKETWHNIPVNKPLTQCEEIPERDRLKEDWYSLPQYPVSDWHWWKAVRTEWGFSEYLPGMVSKVAVIHGLLLPRKRNW